MALPDFRRRDRDGWRESIPVRKVNTSHAAPIERGEQQSRSRLAPPEISSSRPGAFAQTGKEERRESVVSRKSARVEGRARLAPTRHRVLDGGFLGGGGGAGGGPMPPPPPTHTRGRRRARAEVQPPRGPRPTPAAASRGRPLAAWGVHPGVSRQQYTIEPRPRRYTACIPGVRGRGGSVTSLPSRYALREATRANALGEGGEWGLDGKVMKWMKSCTSATARLQALASGEESTAPSKARHRENTADSRLGATGGSISTYS